MATEFFDRPPPAAASWQTRCLNCAAPLSGPYCAACGQKAMPAHPSMHELLHDALEEFVHWDGKIWETLRQLVMRPGALTCDAVAGRRARHIPPLRLYLTCSVIYFLLAALSPARGMTISFSVSSPGESAASGATIRTEMSDEERRAAIEGADNGPRLLRPLVRRTLEDPAGLQRDLLEAWPKVLFVLLPVFAALLALFYHRRSFAAHVYFALHLHAFAFVAMALSTIAKFVRSTPVTVAAGIAVFIWISTYLHVALRRVYGGSQVMTMVKETGVGLLYGVATVPLFLVAAIWIAWHPH
jgi:hypothetical protein